jgi:hypothetical protein
MHDTPGMRFGRINTLRTSNALTWWIPTAEPQLHPIAEVHWLSREAPAVPPAGERPA